MKPTATQLAADLAIAHLALRNIVAMLDRRMDTGDDLENNVFYNVGKATGTAKRALIESGHDSRHPKALSYIERSIQTDAAERPSDWMH